MTLPRLSACCETTENHFKSTLTYTDDLHIIAIRIIIGGDVLRRAHVLRHLIKGLTR